MPDPDPPEDDHEPLLTVFELCIEAAGHIDPAGMPDLHAAMQALLRALGVEMGKRLRGPAH